MGLRTDARSLWTTAELRLLLRLRLAGRLWLRLALSAPLPSTTAKVLLLRLYLRLWLRLWLPLYLPPPLPSATTEVLLLLWLRLSLDRRARLLLSLTLLPLAHAARQLSRSLRLRRSGSSGSLCRRLLVLPCAASLIRLSALRVLTATPVLLLRLSRRLLALYLSPALLRNHTALCIWLSLRLHRLAVLPIPAILPPLPRATIPAVTVLPITIGSPIAIPEVGLR